MQEKTLSFFGPSAVGRKGVRRWPRVHGANLPVDLVAGGGPDDLTIIARKLWRVSGHVVILRELAERALA
jgi:hypothetical protein